MRREALKESGFDEVFDSQRNFRVLMDGMSRPGEVFQLKKHSFIKAPEGFNPNILTILKTLGDNNCTYALAKQDQEEIRKYIEVNTGMRAHDLNKAEYVLFNGREYQSEILLLNAGTLEFPENGSTMIIAVENILREAENPSPELYTRIHMKGPGIEDTNTAVISGLDIKYIQSLAEVNAVFPLGIDAILVDLEGNIVCMPRTTKTEVK